MEAANGFSWIIPQLHEITSPVELNHSLTFAFLIHSTILLHRSRKERNARRNARGSIRKRKFPSRPFFDVFRPGIALPFQFFLFTDSDSLSCWCETFRSLRLKGSSMAHKSRSHRTSVCNYRLWRIVTRFVRRPFARNVFFAFVCVFFCLSTRRNKRRNREIIVISEISCVVVIHNLAQQQ